MLSLDVGRRRIGLAGCDGLGITVTPLPALHRGPFEADLTLLRRHCRERRVQGLVVGLPLDAAGDPTAQAVHCRRYGLHALAKFGAEGLEVRLHTLHDGHFRILAVSNHLNGLDVDLSFDQVRHRRNAARHLFVQHGHQHAAQRLTNAQPLPLTQRQHLGADLLREGHAGFEFRVNAGRIRFRE